MLLLSSVNLKLRDLAASLIPHLLNYAETGRMRSSPTKEDQAAPETTDEPAFEDFPQEFDPEAVHIVVEYLSHQWIPPNVKPAYDEMVRGLRYDS